MLNKLNNGEPLSFIRVGDGEIETIYNYNMCGCDNSFYFIDMGIKFEDALIKALRTEDVYVGLQSARVMEKYQYEVNKLLLKYGIDRTRMIDADILHKMSERGEFADMFKKMCDTKKVLVVGKEELSALPFNCTVLPVPSRNCWLYYEQIYRDVCNTDFDVYMFCCGTPAKLMILDMWEKNKTRQYIDAGSLLDPYAGLITRKYHKKVLNNESQKNSTGICDNVKA